ncbi:MAG: acyl-CoA dehydrogenase family protein [Pseudomonadota bacterium]
MADGLQFFSKEAAASEAFRTEVDRFLNEALTDELRAAGRATVGMHSESSACRIWWDRLLKRGWLAPSWPRAYGGADWSADQRLYFENACAERDAPILFSSGIRTIGPLIIHEGSAAQKARYLPRILSGEDVWCQGFSEPQAGSDLSALSMKGRVKDDVVVLNGNKLWTSMAHEATHMFLLVRTEPGSSAGEGISFLLVDLTLPGITIRPIPTIDGQAEVNEVWFEDVRTPVADRIGELGAGWQTAKRLMAIARGNNTTTGLLRRSLRAARRGLADPMSDPPSSDRLTALEMQVDGLEALEHRVDSGAMPIAEAPAASVVKLIATELHQLITEAGCIAAPNSDFAQARYLALRAASIYSGTSEIHRNILARAIGAPR